MMTPYGVREICDVVLRAKSNVTIGDKLSPTENEIFKRREDTVYATGGRGNSRLIAWEGERTVTFNMEDALISPAGFAILTGAGLIESSEDRIIPVHKIYTNKVIQKNTLYVPEEPYLTDLDQETICIMKLDENGNFLPETYKGIYNGEYKKDLGYKVTTSIEINSNNLLPLPDKHREELTCTDPDLGNGFSTYNLNDDGSLHFNWSTPLHLTHYIEFDNAYLESDKNYIISTNIIGDSPHGIQLIINDIYYDLIQENPIVLTSSPIINSIKLEVSMTGLSSGICDLYIWLNENEVKEYDKYSAKELKVNDMALVDYYTPKASGAIQIDITPDKFAGNYYLEASTLFKDENGKDQAAEFIIPNCKIQSNFTFNMASSGDPSTFNFIMDAFPDYTRFDKSKKVLAALQIVKEETSSNDVVRKRTAHK